MTHMSEWHIENTILLYFLPLLFFCCSYFTNIFLWLQYFSYTSYYSTIKVGAAAVSGCTAHKHTSSSNGTRTRTRTQHTLVTMVIARDECDCVCIGVFTELLGSSSGMQRQQRRYWLWWWRRRRRRRLRDVTSPTANTHARTHMYNFVVVVSILVVHFFFLCTDLIFSTFLRFFFVFQANYSLLVCILSQNTSFFVESHTHT